MLQPIYPYPTAVSSPCGGCDKMGKLATYPGCSADCKPVNLFLSLIGDIPHHKPETNLHLKYPAIKSGSGTPAQLTSPEDCWLACQKLRIIKKKTGWSARRLGKEIGLSQAYIQICLNGKRPLIRMGRDKFEKIMRFEYV